MMPCVVIMIIQQQKCCIIRCALNIQAWACNRVQDDGDFEKIGLVKILEVGDERAHYDWDTQAHSHIRCIRCNKVEDMMGIDLQAIKTIADQGSEYQITGQHITFEGVCPECAKKESH